MRMSHIGTRCSYELHKLFTEFCEKNKRSKSEVVTTAVLKEITGKSHSTIDEWRPLAAKLFDIPISKVRYAVSLPTIYEALLFMSDKSSKMTVDRIPDPNNHVYQFILDESIYVVSVPNELAKEQALCDILVKLESEMLGDLEKWANEL